MFYQRFFYPCWASRVSVNVISYRYSAKISGEVQLMPIGRINSNIESTKKKPEQHSNMLEHDPNMKVMVNGNGIIKWHKSNIKIFVVCTVFFLTFKRYKNICRFNFKFIFQYGESER